jgi:transcriptional regulator with XRE-family HTH domain
MKSNEYLDLVKITKKLKNETKLAELLNISKQHLYKIRREKINISGDLFISVSEAANINLSLLVLEIHKEKSTSNINRLKWENECLKINDCRWKDQQ